MNDGNGAAGSSDADEKADASFAGADRRSPQLSRDFIFDAAIEFIDAHGLSKLTMRNLGAACGVEGMALYRYVHSRSELLTGVVDYIAEKLHADQLAARRQEDGWQDYLVRLAHGVRQIALDHPGVFPLVATQAPEVPWVRPPLRSLRWMETFLDTLISYGFGDVAAVTAYRTYTTFLLGQLLLEVSGRGIALGPGQQLVEDGDRPTRDLSDYPHLQRLEPSLSQDHSTAGFEEMLEVTLDRIELLASQR